MKEETESMELDAGDLVQIENKSLVNVVGYSLSVNREKLIISTENGMVLVDNKTLLYTKFENANSPFWTGSSAKQGINGVGTGSAVQSRSEVALVPLTESRKFKRSCIYIYDYKMRAILYVNNFSLPIRQAYLNQKYIIVSNAKRVIIYNYLNDFSHKDQNYYLQQYRSSEENERLRYLETHCAEYPSNEECKCVCGQFVVTAGVPFKMLYVKVSTINKIRHKTLMLYDEKKDKQEQFDTIPDEEPFSFAMSASGDYLCYTENYGRSIKVYNLQTNSLHCVMWLGRTISRIISLGFIESIDPDEPKQSKWVAAIREKQNSLATMHLFRIALRTPTESIQSQYKRYFSLFQKTFRDYNIAPQVIGPDFYMHNGVVHSFSLCGVVHDIIDFKRSGNHDKKKVQNFLMWSEDSKLSSKNT